MVQIFMNSEIFYDPLINYAVWNYLGMILDLISLQQQLD
jgi:hypothetical protein